MINFYQAWKDEKAADRAGKKKKKPSKQHKCILCGKRVNGLKRHVEDSHGEGSWKAYVAAQEELLKMETLNFMRSFEEKIK